VKFQVKQFWALEDGVSSPQIHQCLLERRLVILMHLGTLAKVFKVNGVTRRPVILQTRSHGFDQ
jgi:hypothetical protein